MNLLNQKLMLSATALVASALTASATLQLRMSDGITTIIVADQGIGDANPAVGVIAYIGPVGAVWVSDLTGGVSKPLVGSPTAPELDLITRDVSVGAGSLSVELTDTGFIGGGTAGAAIGGNTVGNVTYLAYINSNNVAFAKTTLIAAQGPFPPGPFSGNAVGLVTANTYSMTIYTIINHSGPGKTACDASLFVTPQPMLHRGDTATIGFWQNKNGQALIKSLPNSPALGNWLGTNFPCLYGNLAGKSDTDVANQFLKYFNVTGQKTYAQILGAAFAVYVTDSDLAGNTAVKYGFNVSSAGAGAKTFNVGPYGTSIGLQNDTSYTVLELLQQANTVCPFSAAEFNALNAIFSGINQLGDRL
jgi:hypothetical protein